MVHELFRKIVLAVGIAMALAAGSAQATFDRSFDLQPNSFLDVLTTSDPLLGYPANAPNNYSFGEHMFNFTLSSVSDIFIELSSLPTLSVIGMPGYDSHVTFQYVALSDSYGQPLFGTEWFVDASSHPGTTHPAPSSYSFSLNTLAAGDYTLSVYGFAPDSYALDGSGAHFTDTGAYRVALAVPEPAEWAMFLAGLGLIGVIARRRSPA